MPRADWAAETRPLSQTRLVTTRHSFSDSPTFDPMARGQSSFGLSSRGRGRGNSRTHFRGTGSWRGGRGRGRGGGNSGGAPTDAAPVREDDGTQMAERFEKIKINDEVDEKLGFGKLDQGANKEGWLINMHAVCTLFFCRHCLLTINRR